MKKVADKHNKSFYYIDIQNQISHYNNLIHTKPDITFQTNKNYSLHSRLKSKYATQMQRDRILENKKLIQKLYQIKKSVGILNQQKYLRKKQKILSMQNDYKTIQIKKERLKENQILLDKIKNAKPQIGNQNQWNHHFNNFKINQKKLSKANNSSLDELQNRFYSTFSEITKKQKLRPHLISENGIRKPSPLKFPTKILNQQRKLLQEYETTPTLKIQQQKMANESTKLEMIQSKTERELNQIKQQKIFKEKKKRKHYRSHKKQRQISTVNTDDKINQIKNIEFQQQQNLKFIY